MPVYVCKALSKIEMHKATTHPTTCHRDFRVVERQYSLLKHPHSGEPRAIEKLKKRFPFRVRGRRDTTNRLRKPLKEYPASLLIIKSLLKQERYLIKLYRSNALKAPVSAQTLESRSHPLLLATAVSHKLGYRYASSKKLAYYALHDHTG